MLKNVVYLKEEDYIKLKTNGTVEVNGQTITYSDNDIYMTPDDTDSKLAAMEAKIYENGLNVGTKWYKHTRWIRYKIDEYNETGFEIYCISNCPTKMIFVNMVTDEEDSIGHILSCGIAESPNYDKNGNLLNESTVGWSSLGYTIIEPRVTEGYYGFVSDVYISNDYSYYCNNGYDCLPAIEELKGYTESYDMSTGVVEDEIITPL